MSVNNNAGITNDDFFQKLVALKLESISKMMSSSAEPVRKQPQVESTRRRFMDPRGRSATNLSKNSLKTTLGSNRPYERFNTPGNNVQFNNRQLRSGHLLPSSDSLSSNCLNKKNSFINKNNSYLKIDGTEDPENGENSYDQSTSESKPVKNSPTSLDPDYRADIVSKLKAKAIRDLLFKVKEEQNVKKINEMKTRPDKTAEKVMVMCDLKSYQNFVDDLFSTGTIPVFRNKTIDLGLDDKQLDYETRKLANEKEVENLERLVTRVFGQDFIHRNYYQTSFFTTYA